jgi:hypothetical protein
MGRHAVATGSSPDVGRVAQGCGLAGGIAWVLALLLGHGGVGDGLVWLGSLLVTAALCGLGLLLVRSDVVALRIFVAIALPTLIWGVLALLHGSVSVPSRSDAVFGAAVALVCALLIARRRPGGPRATL